ncbi:MAG TPA: glycosyltransferase family 39 protein [Chloroflexia bacterium]|nr:glycosyltransferase family 39 protein [Chloroflexia bacterium]
MKRWLLALGVAAGVSRATFVRDTPINWDGVQFALALREFDLHLHQPHPPGYILYVLLGRALNILVGEPELALSLMSVLFSVAAVPLLYWLTLRAFGEHSIALGAALLLLASPLALYYGAVGLTYAPEMALSIAVAGIAWKVRADDGPLWIALLLGLALAFAGGIRQTSFLVLLPLCIWALWRNGRNRWLAFVGALLVSSLAWLVPLLMLSGGVEPYLRENALLAQEVSERTSIVGAGIEGLGHNLLFEGLGLMIGLAFGVVPLGLWVARVLRFSLAGRVRSFLAWWTLPSLALYAVTHVGQYGYLLAVLPPLLMLSALCARVAAERLSRGRNTRAPAAGVYICAVLALASAGYFILSEGPVTASSIARNDEHWHTLRTTLGNMDPRRTALVMSVEWAGPFRLAGYLLPDFQSFALGEDEQDKLGWLYSAHGGRSNYALPHPPATPQLDLPEGTRTIVVLDDDTARRLAGESDLKRVSLADGSPLYVLSREGAVIRSLVVQGEAIRAVYGEAITDDTDRR